MTTILSNDENSVVLQAEEFEGQLAIDVYQTNEAIIIKAPIAGVNLDDLEVSVTDDVINIRGERKKTDEISPESYLTQECYWGSFSRSYILPVAIDHNNVKASLSKNGVLIITLSKLVKSQTHVIEVGSEE